MGLSNSYPNEINPMAVQSPELNLSRHTRVSSPTRLLSGPALLSDHASEGERDATRSANQK